MARMAVMALRAVEDQPVKWVFQAPADQKETSGPPVKMVGCTARLGHLGLQGMIDARP